MTEAERQLDYLGVVKDAEECRRAARFIATGYVDKKRVRAIMEKLHKAETYGNPAHETARQLRAEVLKDLAEELGE
jgi:hypothetical protein